MSLLLANVNIEYVTAIPVVIPRPTELLLTKAFRLAISSWIVNNKITEIIREINKILDCE
ncbi:MAG: hypothetical protein ACTSP7_06350 [Candidatus Heimdallarchaeota archaeon]